MKVKNMPLRKLIRQIDANRNRAQPYTEQELSLLADARDVRTKKYRGNKSI